MLIGHRGVQDIELPTLQADGVLVEPFGQPTQSEVAIDGQLWTMLEFNTTVVPIRSGILSLGPATLNCRLAVPRQRRSTRSPFGHDPFEDVFGDSFFEAFFGGTERYPVTLTSEPIQIEVLPLPEEGKPHDFAGAIGRFRLEVTAVPNEVSVGEPVTVTMTIRGDGNVDTVTAPTLLGPLEQFKVYEPKALAASPAGHPAGQKVFEQILIPLDASINSIPAIRFAFFDPSTSRYETQTEGPLPLRVNPAPREEPVQVIEHPTSLPPEPLEVLGRDIVYIKEDLGALRVAGQQWWTQPGWILWQVSPLLLLVVSESVRRRRQRFARDPGLARASGALKRALAQCRAARRLQEESQVGDGYAAIVRVWQRYIGDRFHLPSEGLTRPDLEGHLKPRKVPEEILREVLRIFDECDAARFAPMGSLPADQLQATLQATESLLKRLERWKPA
jgi:hypothetical protein